MRDVFLMVVWPWGKGDGEEERVKMMTSTGIRIDMEDGWSCHPA